MMVCIIKQVQKAHPEWGEIVPPRFDKNMKLPSLRSLNPAFFSHLHYKIGKKEQQTLDINILNIDIP